MKKIRNIFSGYFLTHKDAIKNWRVIVFLSVLSIIIIDSGHRADKKVFKIAKLNNEIKRLRSEYVENKTRLIHLKMESKIQLKLKKKEIFPSTSPPVKIIIE